MQSTKMVSTRKQSKESIDYLIKEVLDQSLSSTTYQALDQYNVHSPATLMSLEIKELDNLSYKDSKGDTKPLFKSYISLIKNLIKFLRWKIKNPGPIFDDWSAISRDEFEA